MKKAKTESFTTKALSMETPRWAKIMFRATFLVTSALTVFIAGTNIIDEKIKFECMLGLKSLDVVIYGFSKMFGIEREEN